MIHRLLLRNPVGSGQNMDCEDKEPLVTKQQFFFSQLKNNRYLHCNTVDLHCMGWALVLGGGGQIHGESGQLAAG